MSEMRIRDLIRSGTGKDWENPVILGELASPEWQPRDLDALAVALKDTGREADGLRLALLYVASAKYSAGQRAQLILDYKKNNMPLELLLQFLKAAAPSVSPDTVEDLLAAIQFAYSVPTLDEWERCRTEPEWPHDLLPFGLSRVLGSSSLALKRKALRDHFSGFTTKFIEEYWKKVQEIRAVAGLGR